MCTFSTGSLPTKGVLPTKTDSMSTTTSNSTSSASNTTNALPWSTTFRNHLIRKVQSGLHLAKTKQKTFLRTILQQVKKTNQDKLHMRLKHYLHKIDNMYVSHTHFIKTEMDNLDVQDNEKAIILCNDRIHELLMQQRGRIQHLLGKRNDFIYKLYHNKIMDLDKKLHNSFGIIMTYDKQYGYVPKLKQAWKSYKQAVTENNPMTKAIVTSTMKPGIHQLVGYSLKKHKTKTKEMDKFNTTILEFAKKRPRPKPPPTTSKYTNTNYLNIVHRQRVNWAPYA